MREPRQNIMVETPPAITSLELSKAGLEHKLPGPLEPE